MHPPAHFLRSHAITTGAYGPVEDMLHVKPVQKKWRNGFIGSVLTRGRWTGQVGDGAMISGASVVIANLHGYAAP